MAGWHRSTLFLAMVVAIGISAEARPLELFVSPKGNDKWSGRLAEPNGLGTDGPLASLEAARDAIRTLKQANKLPGDGATVLLREGRYFREKPFLLTSEDRGPVTYRAYKEETAEIVGGRELTGFAPVTDAAIKERLDPVARDAVRQVDLKALGVTDVGRMTNGGQGRSALPEMPELFVGEKRMTLARWPNGGKWATVKSVPENSAGRFVSDSDRPARWKNADDAWVYGYWQFDWADSYDKIAAIDTAKNEITTAEPFPVYGIGAGKRWFALNILEELDEPGEWYLDRKTGILYFWPPADAGEDKPVFSMVKGGLIEIEGASQVTIQGLTLEMGREDGVTIRGGSGNRVAGCTIRNLGRYAVSIQNATESGVASCEISETGLGGIALSGGDRKTLTPGKLYADNNHIHHISRLLRTYKPAVALDGVGNRVTHNFIHDLPHTAIQGGGNDHLIEFNEITRVCTETGDAGAFYMGRDLTQRGNLIRYNYFHHLRGGALEGQTGFTDVMAVYLDDCFSGTTIYGNIFLKAGRTVMIGGGRDNIVENNIIWDGSPAIHVDARGKGWAANHFGDKGDWRIFQPLTDLNVTQPPYSVRYPQLVGILNDDPAFPKGNHIEHNIIVGGKPFELQDNLTDIQAGIKDNLVTEKTEFDGKNKDGLTLKDKDAAKKIGFKPIPSTKIGLYKDEFRKNLPSGSL